MSALRLLLERNDDGQQAFLRLMKGSTEVSNEVNALRKTLSALQHVKGAADPEVRSALSELDRVAHKLERSNGELRNSLQSSKRFFGEPT